MKGRRGLCLILAALMTAGAGFTSFAADTKIDPVKLTFTYDKAPESGDDIGSISAAAGSAGYIVESAEYTNADDQDVWTVGDIPEVKVELSAKDGFKFSYTSKSRFSLSGCNAEFKKAKITDSGNYIEVYVTLKRIGGKLEGASELNWEDTTAYWNEIEGAKSYDVKLLRNERTVTTISTTGTSYNFAGYFNREGDYTFRVRAISRYNSKAGQWSEDSGSFYIDDEDVDQYSGSGRWQQNQQGWWYAYDSGGYPASCWKEINGARYYFNSAGYMLSGWNKLDNSWYYMNPSGAMTTGWQAVNGQWYYMNGSGEMQTGWQNVNNRWYYMNSSGVMLTGWQHLNGQWYYMDGSGAMLTGWQAINGKWYFLASNGAMYANTYTPDGRYVDGSGVWVQ